MGSFLPRGSHNLIFPRLNFFIHRMKQQRRWRLCWQCAPCLLNVLLAGIETVDLLLWRNEEKEVGEVQPVRVSDNSSCFRSQIPCQIEGRDCTSGCIPEHCLHPQGEKWKSGALSFSEGATIKGGIHIWIACKGFCLCWSSALLKRMVLEVAFPEWILCLQNHPDSSWFLL